MEETDSLKRRTGFFKGEEKYIIPKCDPYLVEYFLYENDYMMIHAGAGIGKTVTALQLLFNLTSKTPLLDSCEVKKKCRVLWLLGESTKEKLIINVLNMKKGSCIDDDFWEYFVNHGYSINIKKELEKMLSEIDIKTYDVIIVDSFYNFYSGDENDNEAAKEMVRNLKYMCDYFGGASLICLGHTNKDQYYKKEKGGVDKITGGNSISGSKIFDAFFTTIYHLIEIDKERKILRLVKKKDRDGNCVDEITYKMVIPQTDELARLKIIDHDKDYKSNSWKIENLLNTTEGKYRAHKIIEELGMQKMSFYRAIRHLIAEGRIVQDVDEHGRKIYYITRLVKEAKRDSTLQSSHA